MIDSRENFINDNQIINKSFSLKNLKGTQSIHQLEYLPIEQLTPMINQPRKLFDTDAIEELAQSIRNYGILQPLVVTKGEDKLLYIVAGERRWRAAKIAGLNQVPCIFRESHDHSELEIALIENIQRENLSPLEEALCMQQLLDDHQYTHEVLAQRLGKNRTSITNSIRILQLPEKIKADLHTKQISAGHAKALISLDTKQLQLKAHQIIINKKLSVRQTEDLVRVLKKDKNPEKLQDAISPDLRYICDQFKGHLGTKVKIAGDTNHGKIEISYYTMDDLERISELILGNFSLERKK
jgi:ParB family chromosome partitioning protein